MRKDEFPIVDKFVKDSINEVLDEIKGYVEHIRNTGMGKKKSLEFIEKYIDGLKAEIEVRDADSD